MKTLKKIAKAQERTIRPNVKKVVRKANFKGMPNYS